MGEEFRPSWEFAANELRKMNDFRTPRDKLVCVLNCCRVLTNLLASSRGDDNPPGADELLPALIFTVIRANPEHMHSNLNFIAQFRHPSKLVSEPGYFFTHVLSAVTFIETIHADALGLGEDEFARRTHDACARHAVDPSPILDRARLQGRRDSVDSVAAAERMREARARATSEEVGADGTLPSESGASPGGSRAEAQPPTDGSGDSSNGSSNGGVAGRQPREGGGGQENGGGDAEGSTATTAATQSATPAASGGVQAASEAVNRLGETPPPLIPALGSKSERELVRAGACSPRPRTLTSPPGCPPPAGSDAVALEEVPLRERKRRRPSRRRAALPAQGV